MKDAYKFNFLRFIIAIIKASNYHGYTSFNVTSINYCPEYNIKANTLDTVPCNVSTESCPDVSFLCYESVQVNDLSKTIYTTKLLKIALSYYTKLHPIIILEDIYRLKGDVHHLVYTWTKNLFIFSTVNFKQSETC